MNIYARYFDQETVASSFEELITFLTAIPEISVTTELLDNVKAYVDSPLPYPKRYKLRPRVYFILIKTNAKTFRSLKASASKTGTTPRTTPPHKHTEMTVQRNSQETSPVGIK